MNPNENQMRNRKRKMLMSAMLAFFTLIAFTMITVTIFFQIQSTNNGFYTSAAVGAFSIIQLFCCMCCCTSCIDYQTYRSHYRRVNIEAPPPQMVNPIPIYVQPSAPLLVEEQMEYQERINQEHPNSQECISCLENVRSVKLSCGHLVLCHLCAHKLKIINPFCPICRVPITEMKENIFSEKDYSPSETPPPAPDEKSSDNKTPI